MHKMYEIGENHEAKKSSEQELNKQHKTNFEPLLLAREDQEEDDVDGLDHDPRRADGQDEGAAGVDHGQAIEGPHKTAH